MQNVSAIFIVNLLYFICLHYFEKHKNKDLNFFFLNLAHTYINYQFTFNNFSMYIEIDIFMGKKWYNNNFKY